MTTETVHTTLQFAGDWPAWAGIGASVALAALAWKLYRPDVRGGGRVLRWVLPSLRALAVGMIVLMLAGPVLHHRRVIGQLSRVLLFVDSSRSMGLADADMELGRKVRIAQALGLLRADAVPMDLPKAGEALAEAQVLAQKANQSLNVESANWNGLLNDFAGQADEAREAMTAGGIPPARLADFAKEFGDPAREVARREMRQIDDRQRAARDLTRLAQVAGRWQNEVSEGFRRVVSERAILTGSPVQTALQRFDAMPRWQRLQAILNEGEKGPLLNALAEKHEVQLFTLEGSSVKKVWESTTGVPTAFRGLAKPTGETTDLAAPIQAALGSDRAGEEHAAIVLFSDGQQNDGESPLEAARVLGGRQLPIYTVGFGGKTRPRDLAVLKVEGPESVFAEDHYRGQVTLKDDMPPGMPFTLTIKDGDRVVWEQKMATTGTNVRRVPFDFAVQQSVAERLKDEKPGVQVSGLPIEWQVSVTALAGDNEPSNNSATTRVRALTQKRRILLIDGRPRWETRYLRNLFERDEQWEVNAVIAGATAGEPGFLRGSEPGRLPSDLTEIAAYDLIILGETPVKWWHPGELQAMRDFVEKRGGALVFIDGPRGYFHEYGETPLAPLFPVEWKVSAGLRENLGHLVLASRAQTLAPFALAAEHPRSQEIWQGIQPPHWISGATPLPGAETLLEVEAPEAENHRAAAVVTRPFGAGKVLYQAIEDTWRWRYEVADQYHVKYWNQMANWIAEKPFAVRDRFISVDAGSITYRPGETADLRVRLRDGQGRPVTDTVADAVLYRDGQRVAAIRLTPDENAGGLFHGRTAQLEPGSYQVAIESAAIPAQEALARTSFKVEPRGTGELSQLSLNEDLLREMSTASGGEYLREEYLDRLLDLLAPLSHGQVIQSETVLAQSYWWFVPLILLLTLEWFLRKRAGML